ncbi:DUF4183 domain-containing protein [Paenibacillus roseipurpureus]|uniref:DUF4183 domain-containing protein n=1 Tax=Paenibacillus roseopurpureus TaxID=2918901 RepID=A0AA96LVW2_9BACL|nr:DUF4183 domain-containing protein [Paenibacillus sp. MBLB1832]WNR45625.1 DUF4183 domain-containing protein [Paenibacillus sp. MBLB1832]
MVGGVIHIRARASLDLTSCKPEKKKKRKSTKAEYVSKTCFFYAISDGDKRCYTEADRTKGYGVQSIPDPETVTFTQVFINGVLQPSTLYRINKGEIIIISKDVPDKGVPIIVQSIRIYKRRLGRG